MQEKVERSGLELCQGNSSTTCNLVCYCSVGDICAPANRLLIGNIIFPAMLIYRELCRSAACCPWFWQNMLLQ